MKILFLCTAFNSLSQRVALVLRSRGHAVTVELALSPELMIEAAELASPDIVVCPFLTKRVPPQIYNRWLTLIVHPGPPGDAGPSAIDWCLFGDMGELTSHEDQLHLINGKLSTPGAKATLRSHWGVTVLQAIEALDAGPIWAFDQFELDAETSAMTKSDLYRGPVTRAAVNGVLAALERIQAAAKQSQQVGDSACTYSPSLTAPPSAAVQCVSRGVPFLGGRTHERPLLKASLRDFFKPSDKQERLLSADLIAQRINSADSQPGVLTSLFGGTLMFVYGAVVQRDPLPERFGQRYTSSQPGTLIATRQGAVLVNAGADLPLWICHVRKPKAKTDKALAPKLPAVMGLLSVPELADKIGLGTSDVEEWDATEGFAADRSQPWKRQPGTYQQVWVEIEAYGKKTDAKVGYVHSDFYNGAFATSQCQILLEAIRWTLAQPGLVAIVMLGGPGYFSNGIALNVIEGSADPSAEGWANINAIDDCVQALLAPRGILTFSALRGNAAAGGLALATAADVVLSIESAVLNPHYRGLGLYGSEWHTYSWYERCGEDVAKKFARDMLPMSASEAHAVGLVDYVIENGSAGGAVVLAQIKTVVERIVTAKLSDVDTDPTGLLAIGAPWTKALRPVPRGRGDTPLPEHLVRNKAKYLAYLFAGSDSGSGDALPQPVEVSFRAYRERELSEMRLDFFHPHRNGRFAARCTAFVRKSVPSSTPFRFALHRRYGGGEWHRGLGEVRLDEEETDGFDSLNGVPAGAAVARLPTTEAPRLSRSGSESTVSSGGAQTPPQEAEPQPQPQPELGSWPKQVPVTVPVPVLASAEPNKLRSFFSSIGRRRPSVSSASTSTSTSTSTSPTKAERRRSVLSPRINSVPTSPVTHAPAADHGSETLWSCYYAENGTKTQ